MTSKLITILKTEDRLFLPAELIGPNDKPNEIPFNQDVFCVFNAASPGDIDYKYCLYNRKDGEVPPREIIFWLIIYLTTGTVEYIKTDKQHSDKYITIEKKLSNQLNN